MPVIRSAQLEDLPAIVALLADDPLGRQREQVADPLPDAYRRAFAAIDQDPRNLLVVAEDAGRIVGILQLTFIPSLTRLGTERAQIEGVRTAADRRGHGIGRELIEWAVQSARAQDCGLVQLTTDKQRLDALRFYEFLGFTASHLGMKLHLGPSPHTA